VKPDYRLYAWVFCILVILLMISGRAKVNAQNDKKPGTTNTWSSGITSANTLWFPSKLSIGEAVEIDLTDGSVKYGKGFKADSAAKEFWTQISKYYPEVCAAKTQAIPKP
jgi:hypothetical protein